MDGRGWVVKNRRVTTTCYNDGANEMDENRDEKTRDSQRPDE